MRTIGQSPYSFCNFVSRLQDVIVSLLSEEQALLGKLLFVYSWQFRLPSFTQFVGWHHVNFVGLCQTSGSDSAEHCVAFSVRNVSPLLLQSVTKHCDPKKEIVTSTVNRTSFTKSFLPKTWVGIRPVVNFFADGFDLRSVVLSILQCSIVCRWTLAFGAQCKRKMTRCPLMCQAHWILWATS